MFSVSPNRHFSSAALLPHSSSVSEPAPQSGPAQAEHANQSNIPDPISEPPEVRYIGHAFGPRFFLGDSPQP